MVAQVAQKQYLNILTAREEWSIFFYPYATERKWCVNFVCLQA